VSEFDQYSGNYRELLDQSVRITGETGEYFAEYKAKFVAARVAPRPDCRILDYGCGTGLVTTQLKKTLPGARVDGYDVSRESLAQIDPAVRSQGTFITNTSKLSVNYDVVMMANVLHHIEPQKRQRAVAEAAGLLTANGKLIIFEHNPANPLTQRAVAACPFDENAILLYPGETTEYLKRCGLDEIRLEYIVFFPRVLSWFRPMEGALRWCPLGAQYAAYGVRGRKQT
jgi:2-polyprenyl-3-methyl-5-hydroxy-6-metoxy-1,4-benzoquinol methylase